ncbi:MAG: hypothetical protein ACYC36_06210 [Bellilinea sp.]
MTEITPEFIAKLRAMLACIETPLPWKSKPAEYESKRYGAEVISGAFITPFTLEFGDEHMGLHDVDAALIVEAANALPVLLDEVERLWSRLTDAANADIEKTREIERLREAIREALDEFPERLSLPLSMRVVEILTNALKGGWK